MTKSTEGIESPAFIIILGITCALAVLANILVLVVIVKKMHFRGVSEAFMANMAVSDILLAGFAIPGHLSNAITTAGGNKNYVGGKENTRL